ncbi:MAG: metallophosphoesterase family protein [Chloroflexi bacterium]|nr:metallophosphoesterase family protein [Chloroflexota bacterium]
MRLALFADIHGNSIALDAVLADIRAQGGVDETWVLGDLVAIGHDPSGTMERLARLPNARFARGNTDRYLVTGELPKPSLADVAQDATLLPKLVEVARSFAWTQGALSSNGWLDSLAQLPVEQRMTLPDGTRLLGAHASAGKDDGRGAHPGIGEAELAGLMENANADLVCVAHTHAPLDMTVNGIRVINLGSVSNSFQEDLRASYAIIEANARGYTIAHRRVEYDRDAVIAAVQQSHHPAGQFIIQYMLGQNTPHWNKHQVSK